MPKLAFIMVAAIAAAVVGVAIPAAAAAQSSCHYCQARSGEEFCDYCATCTLPSQDCVTNCTQPSCHECSPGGVGCSGFALQNDTRSRTRINELNEGAAVLVIAGEEYLVRPCQTIAMEINLRRREAELSRLITIPQLQILRPRDSASVGPQVSRLSLNQKLHRREESKD